MGQIVFLWWKSSPRPVHFIKAQVGEPASLLNSVHKHKAGFTVMSICYWKSVSSMWHRRGEPKVYTYEATPSGNTAPVKSLLSYTAMLAALVLHAVWPCAHVFTLTLIITASLLWRQHRLIHREHHRGRSCGDYINSLVLILVQVIQIEEQQWDLWQQFSTQLRDILAHWNQWWTSTQIIYPSSLTNVFL